MNIILLLMFCYVSLAFCADVPDVQHEVQGFAQIISAKCGDPGKVYETIVTPLNVEIHKPAIGPNRFGYKFQITEGTVNDRIWIATACIAILNANKENSEKLRDLASRLREKTKKLRVYTVRQQVGSGRPSYENQDDGQKDYLYLDSLEGSLSFEQTERFSDLEWDVREIILLGHARELTPRDFQDAPKGVDGKFEFKLTPELKKIIFSNVRKGQLKEYIPYTPGGEIQFAVMPFVYLGTNCRQYSKNVDVKEVIERQVRSAVQERRNKAALQFSKDYPGVAYTMQDLESSIGPAPVVVFDFQRLKQCFEQEKTVFREQPSSCTIQ